MMLSTRYLATAVLATFVAVASACDNGSGTFGVVRGTARLASLTLSAGTINPAFDANTLAYTASVPNATTTTTVTASAATNGATIKIANVAVSSGAASGPINLAVGTTPIPIEVTNPDGGTSTYTVTVTRAP